MQRGLCPRRTAVLARNALRVADEQSLGLLVGLCCGYVRLAARVSCGVDDSDFWQHPSKADSTRSAHRADLSVQGKTSVSEPSSLLVCYRPLVIEEFCPKKLPRPTDDRWPSRRSARYCVRASPTRPRKSSQPHRCESVPQRAPLRHSSPRQPTHQRATMGQRVSLQEELINMKITSKQMVSASKKCEKNEKKYRKDVKKAGSRRPTSVPSLQYESSPGMTAVGGLLFDFEAVRTDSTEMLRAGHREGQRGRR